MFQPKAKRAVVFAIALAAMCFLGAYVAFGIGYNGLPPIDWSVPFLSDVLREPSGAVCDSAKPVTMVDNDWRWSKSVDATIGLIAARGLEAPPVKATYYKKTKIWSGGVSVNVPGVVTTYTAPITFSQNERWKLEFWSVDMEGVAEPVRTAYVGIDTQAPVTSMSGISPDTTTSASWAKIKLNPEDWMSGVSAGEGQVNYILDSYDPADPYWESAYGTITVGPGHHTLLYRSTDRAGNTEGTKTVEFGVGGPEQYVPWTSAFANGDWFYEAICYSSMPVTVTLEPGTESPAGILGTRYSIVGATTAIETTYTGEFQISAPGESTITYYSIGVNGQSEQPQQVKVVIDDTAPTTRDDHVAAYTHGLATISIEASDTIGKVDRIVYRLDPSVDATPLLDSNPDAADNWEGLSLFKFDFKESNVGSHTLEYAAYDKAGNVSRVTTVTFEITKSESIPPTPTILFSKPLVNGWYQGPVDYTVGGTDASSTPVVGVGTRYDNEWPGSGFSTGTISLEGTATHNMGIFPPVPGTQSVFYWATDSNNNVSAPSTASVDVDMYKPAVWTNVGALNVAGVVTPQSFAATTTPSITAMDLASGVASMTYSMTGPVSVATTTTRNSSATLPAVALPGKYVITYQAQDVAGRLSGTKTTTFYIKKATAVTLTTRSASGAAYGGAFYIKGSVKSGGVGIPAGVRVVLMKSTNGGVTYANVSTAFYTVAGGAFTVYDKPVVKTYYKVRCYGSDAYFASNPSAGIYVLPKVYLTNPVAPLAMYHTRYYTVYGYLRPRHYSPYAVRIYKYRYVSGRWVSYGYSTAKAYYTYSSTTSKYAASIKLPYVGKWRLRTYAPTDAGHYATWSAGYDYVTVK